MAVLVVSDSHGLKKELSSIVERHQHEVSTFIHCGDSELKTDDEILQNYQVVRGNCDVFGYFSASLIIEADGMQIFVSHGHQYGVKSSLTELAKQTKQVNCQIACFGHSHRAVALQNEGIIFINPGSIKQPRGSSEKTYAIFRKNTDKLSVDFYSVDGLLLQDRHVTLDIRL